MAEPLFATDSGSAKQFEIKRYGYTMVLEISADGVECRCTYEPATTGGTPLSNGELHGFLAQYKIINGVIPEGLAELLNSAATAKAVSGLLIACGTPMLPGKDGELVVVVPDAVRASQESDEGNSKSGTVDLRNVQSFFNVEPGQLVAEVRPPGPGTPGKTVFGKVIPPVSGTPLTLVLGQNVHGSDDRRSIFAQASGRVCVQGTEISVEDIYEIDGNVDFRVGNILFNGFVEVKGDVLDGFSVKATKGIKIHGIIGVCAIESEGDISFSGLNGQGAASVICGGSVTANYIYDSVIECNGNVTIEVEVRNTQIRCLGAIIVNKGGMAGGEYFALAGVESAIIGNITSLPTRVVAGVHYKDLEELNSLFNELKQLIEQFKTATKDAAVLKELTLQRADITERTQAVRVRTYESCNAKINCRKNLYAGVIVTLGNLSENVKEDRPGPLSIIENTIDGGFRYLGMTPLTFNAQAIEETFIRQQQIEQKN